MIYHVTDKHTRQNALKPKMHSNRALRLFLLHLLIVLYQSNCKQYFLYFVMSCNYKTWKVSKAELHVFQDQCKMIYLIEDFCKFLKRASFCRYFSYCAFRKIFIVLSHQCLDRNASIFFCEKECIQNVHTFEVPDFAYNCCYINKRTI